MGKIIGYYQHIDTLIGEIMNKLGREHTLFVISDHGGDKKVINFNINEWLRIKGLLHLKKSSKAKKKSLLSISGSQANAIATFLEKHGLVWVKKFIKTFIPWRIAFAEKKDKISLDNIEWRKTKAFVSPEANGIFINSKERFQQGIVGKKEASVLKNKIIKDLKKIRDPWGKRINVIAKKTEEVYNGPYVKNAVDILYFFKDYGHQTDKGVLWKKINAREASGKHSMDGIFLAWGKEIVKNKRITNARLIDMTPTILAITRTPVPTDIDGRVLNEIFRGRKRVKTLGKPDKKTPKKKSELSREKQRIAEAIERLNLKLH